MQPRLFKNPNPSLLWIGKNFEVYTAQDQHFKTQCLNLWMNWERICLNSRLIVENKMRNLHKKRMRIRWVIYIEKDWDIPFPKSLKIHQWIGKNIVHWGKWKEPIRNSANTTEYFVTRPWRYIFLTYVYRSIALVKKAKRIKYWYFFSYLPLFFVFSRLCRFSVWMRDTCVAQSKFKIIGHINI